MARKIGKIKVSAAEFAAHNSKLDVVGGTITGKLNVVGDITGSSDVVTNGTILTTGDLSFQIQNDTSVIDILRTDDEGESLSLYNNTLYIEGGNVGVGQTNPRSKFHIGDGTGQELLVEGTISASGNITTRGVIAGKCTSVSPGVTGTTLLPLQSGAIVFITGSAPIIKLPPVEAGLNFTLVSTAPASNFIISSSIGTRNLNGSFIDFSNDVTDGTMARSHVETGSAMTLANNLTGEQIKCVSNSTSWYLTAPGGLNDTPTFS